MRRGNQSWALRSVRDGREKRNPADKAVFDFCVETMQAARPMRRGAQPGSRRTNISLTNGPSRPWSCRAGLEDNMLLDKHTLAPSNAALIKRAADVCEQYERLPPPLSKREMRGCAHSWCERGFRACLEGGFCRSRNCGCIRPGSRTRGHARGRGRPCACVGFRTRHSHRSGAGHATGLACWNGSDRVPVPALVRALKGWSCPICIFVHKGLTSRDVVDTAQALLLSNVNALFESAFQTSKWRSQILLGAKALRR